MPSERPVKDLTRRKIVFVIVEGPTDETALGVLLNRICNRNTVHVEIMHGDITNVTTTKSRNMEKIIREVWKNYADSYHFRPSDFKEIVHIIDMDGAFIPDENIVTDSTKKHIFYTDEQILCRNRDNIIYRNHKKQKAVNEICHLSRIGKIPYSAYFMSCNLDHVISNRINIGETAKEAGAHAFVKRYRKDLAGFVDFMTKTDFVENCDDYVSSWNFIRKGTRSLERHTNLGICIRRFIRENGQESLCHSREKKRKH